MTKPTQCEDGLRCLCGRMLAKQVDTHIELMCRRCKRVAIITLEDLNRGKSVSITFTDMPSKPNLNVTK
ncbi:MAG: hypothetical protein JKY56_12790 [Kofleriaceae bacterium]|nr:hypothetical protein [Kofleriaceae bacterium]